MQGVDVAQTSKRKDPSHTEARPNRATVSDEKGNWSCGKPRAVECGRVDDPNILHSLPPNSFARVFFFFDFARPRPLGFAADLRF